MKPILPSARARLAAWFAIPLRLVVLGYAFYVTVGWLLLLLPPCHRTGASADWLDHLFTAVSAVSTTGLVTVSTADTYSGFGQAVVLALIQIGGLGYMTLGSFTVLSVTGRLTPLSTLATLRALVSPMRVGT